MVYEYADGTLDAAQEESLFMALSGNEELRSELKQLLAMKAAVKSDTLAYTPSAAATMGLFNALGFSASGVATGAAISSGIKFKLLSFIGKYSHSIISGIVSSVITAIVVFYFLKPAEYNQNGSYFNNSNYSQNKSQIQAPVTSSFEDKIAEQSKFNNNSRENAGPKIINRIIYVHDTIKSDMIANSDGNNHIINSKSIQNIDIVNEQDFEINKNQSKDRFTDLFSRASISNSIPSKAIPVSYSLHYSQFLGLVVEIKGLTNWSFPSEVIHPSKYQSFNDLSLSLHYPFGSELAIGADYRRENFYQKFEFYDESKKRLYEITQQPNFNTISGSIRISPESISFWNIKPFGQLMLGINEVGYVGRIMLGTEIMSNEFASFVLGFEGNGMIYSVQNKWYFSPKIGVNYGVRLKF